MDDPNPTLSILNVFEIQIEGVNRHLICFLDPILAGAAGIPGKSVVGEYQPGADGQFDLDSFELNPEFVDSYIRYMNEVAIHSPDLVAEATQHESGWLYVLDPRYNLKAGVEPPASELIGCYAVDETGRIAPGSFQYNENHVWFEPESGTSGILSDRRFYDWLHPRPE
jgi:hypothetical protein